MTLGTITSLVHSYGYLALFLLVALESVGIPLPGETALITAALYAGSTGNLSIVAVAVIATAAAVLGDNAGYWLGKVGGQRFVALHGHRVGLDVVSTRASRPVVGSGGFPSTRRFAVAGHRARHRGHGRPARLRRGAAVSPGGLLVVLAAGWVAYFHA